MNRSDLVHADKVAAALGVDMAEYWTPTVNSYLGRVTKALIVEAVREVASDRDADSFANLKKAEMASNAERLLAETRWVPSVLRTPEPVAMPNRLNGRRSQLSKRWVGPLRRPHRS